jgi:hypothetical protein
MGPLLGIKLEFAGLGPAPSHSNGTCSFPAFRFHEWLCEVRREGISETRLTYRVHQRVDLLLLTFERQMIG